MSSAFELPSFSVTDVDDIMEVSSEHGHHGGDEDIDIDIDLTAGQVDEDYVLEDATSNNGFEDDFHPQQSPAAGNDDLMIDDEYEFRNEDVIQEDETDSMDHEAFPTSFKESTNIEFEEQQITIAAPTESAITEGGDQQARGTPHAAEAPATEIEAAGDPSEGIKRSVTEGDANQIEDMANSLNEDSSSHPVEEIDPSKAGLSPNGSRSSTPHNLTATATDHPNNPPATSPGSLTETPDRPLLNDDTNISEESGNDTGVHLVDEPSDSTPSCEVVVMYQDSEYALFSTSESDDIDSYFLSDFSVTQKPLSSFFEAIRDIIHEDLADYDELFIVVEDLKLELLESSASSQMVTFGQVMDLHTKLLRNDGVETPQLLHLYLGTRTNFFTRFDDLTKSAAEGRGLSEVVQWDDDSESPDEFGALAEDQQEKGSPTQTQEFVVANDFVQQEEANTLESSEASDLPGSTIDPASDQGLAKTSIDAQVSETADLPESISNPTAIEKTDAEDGSTMRIEEAIVHRTEPAPSSGEYDDSDLIDYSDVEPETPFRAGKRVTSGSGKLRTDNSKAHNAEYEAKNEELHRRSLSRPAEDDGPDAGGHELLVSQSSHPEDDDGFSESILNAEDGVDYDDVDHAEDSSGYVDVEHEESSAANGEAYRSEVQGEKDDNDLFYVEDRNDCNGSGDLEGNDLTSELQSGFQDDEQGTNTEHENGIFDDGLEFGDYLGPSEGDSATHHGSFPGDSQYPLEDSTNSELGSADAENSESIGSDKTLEAQPRVEPEQEDEIDYDDDEEADTSKVAPTALEAKAAPAPYPGQGKRPRAEDLSDEGISSRDKEAKRPRS